METIIRVAKDHDADPYFRMDKIPVDDPEISFKAKGILAYVLSKPDGWKICIPDLDNHATDGEKSIRSGIDELIQRKYCRRFKLIHAETKRILKWLYVFYERPYPGSLAEIATVEVVPDTQNGDVAIVPDTQKPHVEKPHVEKPHVEKAPPINKLFKQLIKTLTNEDTNNNKPGQAAGALDRVVVDLSDNQKQKYLKLETRAKKLGWIGNTNELLAFYMADADYLEAWISKVEKIRGLNNPAGLLRKGLRSGERPATEKEKEMQALADLGLTEDEIAAMV